MNYLHNRALTEAFRALALVLIYVTAVGPGVAPLAYAQSEGETDTTATEGYVEEAPDTDVTPDADEAPDTEVLPDTDETPATEEVTEEGAEGTDTPDTEVSTEESQATDGEASPTGTTTIETGDATTTADVGTDSNYNDTDLGATTASTTIENDNTATTTNGVEVGATTGKNAGTGAAVVVDTGKAVASANVINVVNTNIVNSTGLFYFLNMLFGKKGADFRSLFSLFENDEAPESGCSLESCEGEDTSLNVSNDNTALLENDLVVRAGTGANYATSTNGSASVTTGSAYASANLVNVANTNIVDANYLLIAVNNFGDLLGDIVFPGADFFRSFLSGGAFTSGSAAAVSNDNTAAVTTGVTAVADTGNNSASSTGAATITTGDGTTAANVFNQVNTNLTGGNQLYMLFRIHGTWAGDIFGLPEGITWAQTQNGIELMLAPGAFAGGGAAASTPSTLAVANGNSATINNNLSVYALTGDNHVSASGGSASVTTGDAMAAANVVNVANTNVIGTNWMLAIFNIFGDWNGNLSFGQPNLWVGARAEVPSDLSGGSCFAYELTVTNFGDASASNIVLDAAFDRALQNFQGGSDLEEKIRFEVGELAAGASKDMSLPVCLTTLAGEGTTVTTDFTVDARETDADDTDNTEQISVVTVRSSGGGGGGGGRSRVKSDLAIEKKADRETAAPGESVNYTITVKNNGSPVYNALLVDTLYDEEEEAVTEHRWDLEMIKEDEEIEISYTVDFASTTKDGRYTNKAYITGTIGSKSATSSRAKAVESPVASATVQIGESSGADQCKQLLTTYIRRGAPNERTEVAKLQYFLKTVEDNASVPLSGIYDEPTYRAVHSFQTKYADDILKPWGVAQSTGFVYYTTQKKINELYCETLEFPLTDTQKREIESFKSRIERSKNAPRGESGEGDVDTSRVGRLPAADIGARLVEVGSSEATSTEEGEQMMSDQVGAAAAAAPGLLGRIKERVSSMLSVFGF